jgi:Tfp pilus assembly protein PilX
MENEFSQAEHGIRQAEQQLEHAATQEQLQAIGLLCREAIISLAQAVYDPATHLPVDGVSPSDTDAKRMLEAFLEHSLPGSPNQAPRKFARAAFDLANDLQHKRTATYRDAALGVVAADAVLRVIELIAGQIGALSQVSPFSKIETLMPALIAEMSTDLKKYPVRREFFVLSKSWSMNIKGDYLAYYFEDHDDLQSKIQILENCGFVINVNIGEVKRYRMVEDFVDLLISRGG